MLAKENELNDVAIYWKPGPRIATILRAGRCPSWGVPRKLRPGGRVALVAANGRVLLIFRILRIEEGVRVMAANSKRYDNGCVLVAKKGTVRTPGPRDPKMLNVNTKALGAFAYFDAATHKSVVYEPGVGGGIVNPTRRSYPTKRYALFANNIGKTLSAPERALIEDYTAWIGDVTMFAHHALRETGLYTDLFIPRCWTLIEAKASIQRRVLREAIGQLYDYQRHYNRSPRLAVLLPERPPQDVMDLFKKRRIIVVWRSRGKSFRDSGGGVLTSMLRNHKKNTGRQ